MAVVKYDTMIDLMPAMWLPTQHQDLDDEDIDEYGRLVIDIPDFPDNTVSPGQEDGSEPKTGQYTNTELRGDQPTPVTEKETSSSEQNTTKSIENKPQKVLPIRHFRDIPIKLLLKRSFQNNRNKPHKKRLKYERTEYETEKLSEPVEEKKKESLATQENDSNPGENVSQNATSQIIVKNNVSSDKPNFLNQSIEIHKEFLPTHKLSSKVVEKQDGTCIATNNAIQRSSPHNSTKKTNFVEKQNTPNLIKSRKEELLSNQKYVSNKVTEHDGTCIIVEYIDQRTFAKNYMNHRMTVAAPDKQNTRSHCIESSKTKLLPAHKHYSKQVEKQDRQCIIVNNINRRADLQSCVKYPTSTITPKKPNALRESIESHKELLLTHRHYPNQVQEETTVKAYTMADNINQRDSPPNGKENNMKSTSNVKTHPTASQFCQRKHQEQKQRISVVSNDFLFRETLETPTVTKGQSKKNCAKRKSPQRYQEALIDFMERQYQLDIRENIPLTVNTKPLYEQPLIEIPDTRLTEVIHVDQKSHSQDVMKNSPASQQKAIMLAKPNLTNKTPITKKQSLDPANESGYNILVHRGPDVNRIVITIANETEVNNNTNSTSTGSVSPFGDQRVPESIHTPYIDASHPSQKKRSYYYKEPSLRSFRRRLPNQHTQRQTRKTFDNDRLYSTDHLLDHYKNVPIPPHYSYISNHYELPTPVIENYYALATQNYYNPVTHGFLDSDFYDRRHIDSDQISSRSTSTVASSQEQYYVDPHEQQILFGPLNLSLKPLVVDERPFPHTEYPEIYSNYPVPVQDYY